MELNWTGLRNGLNEKNFFAFSCVYGLTIYIARSSNWMSLLCFCVVVVNRDGPLEKLWGGGIFFSLSNSLYEFFFRP